ncbi:ShlB/FhaC/HecB family hemolysin secretion/activation protein [Yersinia frederiksenii]|nr:ShlB/FhaC/HecB family hemolysin secretion/activation protein [Yersinia frederiksenii]CNL58926.1 hemolysin activator protein precursor [Yersinia frederiksenii]CQH60484.1 hemolysin activator protein precursor [Yersinia frederiksenii]
MKLKNKTNVRKIHGCEYCWSNVTLLLFLHMNIGLFSTQVAAEIVSSNSISHEDQRACVLVNNIEISHLYAFPNAANLKKLASDILGQCLGEKGLLSLMTKLQAQLASDGFITSRVVFADKHYSDGTLYLKLMAGRIENIKHDINSTGKANLGMLFPSQPGELVNLRDIEQGLDNLQRLPSVNATMDIEINKDDLSSQIKVNQQQARLWRAKAYFDDGGSHALGQHRFGLILSIDNPFSLGELLYLSLNRDADKHHDKGYSNYALHYSVPYGNWLLSMTGSQGRRYQSLILADNTFQYSTRWNMFDVRIQRLLSRGDHDKTSGYGGLLIRQSASFFANKELRIQRIKTTDWQLGIEYYRSMPWATLMSSIRYQQGATWWGARSTQGKINMPPARLMAITGSLDIPFKLGAQAFNYQPAFSHQYTYSAINVQDRFSVGGRQSVRGFNGNSAVVGPQGWYVRNDVLWHDPIAGQQTYFGMDYGEVSEGGHSVFRGNRLVGAVVGVRGRYHSVGYDFNVGIPIIKPDKTHADPWIFGFSMTWQY